MKQGIASKGGPSARSFRIRYGLVVTLLVSATGGTYASLGGIGLPPELFAFRVLALLAMVAAIVGIAPRGRLTLAEWAFVTLVGVLLLWGLSSLIWLEDPVRAVAEMGALIFPLLGAIALVVILRRSPELIDAVKVGWIASFLLTLVIAIWELRTGGHLPGSYSASHGIRSGSDVESWASATFNNPNDFAGYLLAVFAFLVAASRRGWRLLLTVFMVGSWVLLLVATGSRTALVGGGVLVLIWMGTSLMARPGRRAGRPPVVAGSLVSVAALLTFLLVGLDWLAELTSAMPNLMSSKFDASSDLLRWNLSELALDRLSASGGLGTGPGSFERMDADTLARLGLANPTNPHNVWLETASQYGLIAGLLLLSIPVLGIWRGLMAVVRRDGADDSWGPALVLLSVGVLGWGLASSSVFTLPMFWMALASVVSLNARLESQGRRLGGMSKHPAVRAYSRFTAVSRRN